MSIGVLLVLWLVVAVLVVAAFSVGAALGWRRGREKALHVTAPARHVPHPARVPVVRRRHLHRVRGSRR